MATLTNPLAPELTGTLSAEVEQLVRERVSTGGLSAYACRDVAAIRRSTAAPPSTSARTAGSMAAGSTSVTHTRRVRSPAGGS